MHVIYRLNEIRNINLAKYYTVFREMNTGLIRTT